MNTNVDVKTNVNVYGLKKPGSFTGASLDLSGSGSCLQPFWNMDVGVPLKSPFGDIGTSKAILGCIGTWM